MNCTNCGSPLKDGVKFCGKCGAKVEAPIEQDVFNQPQQQTSAVEEKPKNKKKLLLIPIIAALLAIAILIPTVILPFLNGKGDVKPFISSLSAGDGHSVAIKSDGTVYATGKYKDEMKDWTEIVALASSGDFTAGLRSDGSVVLAGGSVELPSNDWSGITQIAVGDNHVIGLKKDGTVVAAGEGADGRCDVKKWKDIVLVAGSSNHTVGVKKDGTVVATGKKDGSSLDVEDWKDIVSVSSNDEVTVGLKKNGTVVITDYDGDTDYNVSKWKDIVQVSAGKNHIVGLKKDGTVVATGDTSNNKTDVSDWKNIKDVSAGGEHTIALKEDGTVVATGDNSQGQCEVENWTGIRIPDPEKKFEIKEIEAKPFYNSLATCSNTSFAIKNGGTVYVTGSDYEDVKNWTDIVALSASDFTIAGLKSDGTILLSNPIDGFSNNQWKDIQQIALGYAHIVGLKKDGTVIAVGNNDDGACDVGDWTDIVQISAEASHTIGVKKDGSVIATGYNDSNACNVESWTDIEKVYTNSDMTFGLKKDGTVVVTEYTGYIDKPTFDVSNWTNIIEISASMGHIVGLKADGTVVTTGSNDRNSTDVYGWKDIVDISTGNFHTIGLKSDGTVVATGDNFNGQCDVSDWTDVQIPNRCNTTKKNDNNQNEVPNNSNKNKQSENDLLNKLKEQTSKKIIEFTYDDFDDDGLYEAFAFVEGNEEQDTSDMGEYIGELWFVNNATAKKLEPKRKSYGYTSINSLLENNNKKFLHLSSLQGNYSLSEVWTVVNGTPLECNLSSYSEYRVEFLKEFDKKTLAGTVSAFDASLEGLGHTWKPYFFYWDDNSKEFREYGGISINENQLVQTVGAKNTIDTIKSEGGNITSILYRDNGIININYIIDDHCKNATLKYDSNNNKVTIVEADSSNENSDISKSNYGGFYKKAHIENLATYPNSFPVN